MKKIGKTSNKYLKIIDKIEKTRTVNNINWIEYFKDSNKKRSKKNYKCDEKD